MHEIRVQSSVEACAAQLREAILKGEYAPQDRLPTERDLADRFKVSRPTARTALISLAAEHLVSSKQGSGYRVESFLEKAGPRLLCSLMPLLPRKKRQALSKDLLRLRRYLALALFEHLREKGKESALDLSAVHQAIEEITKAPDIVEADLAVISALLDVADSVVLKLCFNPIAHIVRHTSTLQRAMYTDPSENALRWKSVCDALENPEFNPLALLPFLESADNKTLARLEKLR